MSEVQRPQKLSSDFSIARILADDRRASCSSFCSSNLVAECLKVNEVICVENDRNAQFPSFYKHNERKFRHIYEDDSDRIQPPNVPSYLKISETNSVNNPVQAQNHVRSFGIVEHADGRNKSLFRSSLYIHVPGRAESSELNSIQVERLEQDKDNISAIVTENPEACEMSAISDAQRDSDPRNTGGSELTWLHCTRYKPPRLPRRSPAGRVLKRRPGKHPRIPFTAFQLQVLEDKYRRSAYLARRDVTSLSSMLRLPQSRVKIWFQNRRARERRESLQSRSPAVVSINDVSQHLQTQATVNSEIREQNATGFIDRPLVNSGENVLMKESS